MKRLSLLLLIAVASGLIATGCGGDDEDEGGEATTGSGEISVVAPTDTSAADSEELQEQADEQLEQIYEDCIASLEQIPENAREEAREGCEALKQ